MFDFGQTIGPDIVSRRELGAANALSSATWSVMLALGAALGGIVAGQWGIYPAFVIDGLTFLLSAVFILRIDYRKGPALVGTILRRFGAGTNWVFSTQLLLQLVPDRVRGRVFSTEFALLTLTSTVSAAAGGWLLDNTSLSIPPIVRASVNIRRMLSGMATLALICGALWALWMAVGRQAEPLAVHGSKGEPMAPMTEEPVELMAGPSGAGRGELES